MPRAFLITNRRYKSAVEYESRDSSPERSVCTAEPDEDEHSRTLKAASPRSPATLPRDEPPTSNNNSSELFLLLSRDRSVIVDHHHEQRRHLGSLTSSGLYGLSSLEQLAEISLATAGQLIPVPRPRDSLWTPTRAFPSVTPPFNGDHQLFVGVSNSRSQSPCYHSSCESDNGEISGGDGNPGDSHVCPECGKRYSTSSNLARHRQTHRSVSDKKARKCPHCDKVYVSMPAFSMHVRTHSQGCQCPYCGKCFSRPWLLQGHIRTHTGEKPFTCPVCSKAFADKSNLRAHIQTHSNTKPFVCTRCGKAFALKSYLYKHEESSCMRFHRHQQDGSRGSASPESSLDNLIGNP